MDRRRSFGHIVVSVFFDGYTVHVDILALAVVGTVVGSVVCAVIGGLEARVLVIVVVVFVVLVVLVLIFEDALVATVAVRAIVVRLWLVIRVRTGSISGMAILSHGVFWMVGRVCHGFVRRSGGCQVHGGGAVVNRAWHSIWGEGKMADFG